MSRGRLQVVDAQNLVKWAREDRERRERERSRKRIYAFVFCAFLTATYLVFWAMR